MLVDFLVIAVIVGLIRGGKIKNLAEMPIKNVEIIFLSFAIRYLPLILQSFIPELILKLNWLFVTISYFLLLYVLFVNRHIRAMYIVAFGVILNFLVISINGWKMPVSLSALEVTKLEGLRQLLFDPNYLYHKVVDSSTKLAFLADIIPMPHPYPKPRVFSIGDFIMGIGMFSFIQNYMLTDKS